MKDERPIYYSDRDLAERNLVPGRNVLPQHDLRAVHLNGLSSLDRADRHDDVISGVDVDDGGGCFQ